MKICECADDGVMWGFANFNCEDDLISIATVSTTKVSSAHLKFAHFFIRTSSNLKSAHPLRIHHA
jgi:hypothetical protein